MHIWTFLVSGSLWGTHFGPIFGPLLGPLSDQKLGQKLYCLVTLGDYRGINRFQMSLKMSKEVPKMGRVRNSGERMSGRERTGADFYPPPPGGGVRSPFRTPGRPGGAPRAQNPGRQRGNFFLTLF